MLNEQNASPVSVMEAEPVRQEELGQMLKASAPQHPALNRVHAKLVASAETEVAISRYDRMHHRHSRS
jgi:hypothetical protein